MKVILSDRVVDALKKAPHKIRRAFDKQLIFLVGDLHHPSLHAKKYDESRGLWQARVTLDWRFYFTIRDDTYWIEDVIPHPK
jgi:mRNA-degrading endonuclease RelE of RelBE toxin-antitoxin system